MLFNSIEFLFFFLPLTLLVFVVLRSRGHMSAALSWLILCSLFFYAWWNPVYLALLLGSAVVNYTLGLKLAATDRAAGKYWLAGGVIFNLGLLGYFKYANFFLDNAALLFEFSGHFEHIVLPLAISFYTFQQITYLVDTRQGLTEAHGFRDYLLFVSFFPQLVAGPIVHHSEMLAQFRQAGRQRDTLRDFGTGYSILVIGLFKKVVIADNLALYATPVFNMAEAGQALHSLDALAGMLAYALQLYFDFSGYSDMAIGLACMFGIRLPVNFQSPYRAYSIIDFWRRWHMTLSRFLRDYLYIPLGGNRYGRSRRYLNLLLTMLLGGLWHGAAWTFVAWGAMHGIYLCINHFWRYCADRFSLNQLRQSRLLHPLNIVLTFFAAAAAFVVFRAESMAGAGHIYQHLANWGGGDLSPGYAANLGGTALFKLEAVLHTGAAPLMLVFTPLMLALAVCWLLPNTGQLFDGREAMIDMPVKNRPAVVDIRWQPGISWALFIALLALCCGLNLTEVSEFLYFQF